MLTSKDLMIGDWVKFPIGNEKIIDLPYIPGKGICPSFAASATLFPVEVEKLSPIPLTPEILEKNGFTQCEPQGYDLYVKDKEGGDLYRIFCQIEPYNYLEIAAYAYPFGEFNKPNIRYVHQLQHCLKLVGIEKEIVL